MEGRRQVGQPLRDAIRNCRWRAQGDGRIPDIRSRLGENGGQVIADEEIEGLGDEATRLKASGYGAQVTYFWRRVNLFLQVHIHCFGTCPTNVDARARPWVDAVDNKAEAFR